MTDTPASRLKLARVAAGFRTAKAFSDKFGIPQSTYSVHEAGTRDILPDVAQDYSDKLGNCSAGWILTGEGRGIGTSSLIAVATGNAGGVAAALEEIEVVGAVQAGHWIEAVEFDPDERQVIRVPFDPRYAGLRKIGLRVIGNSMNRVYPPGSTLIVVEFIHLGRDARPGERVIVRRRRPDSLVEVTVKEFVIDNERKLLWPRSTNPAYQTALPLDDPGSEDENEDIRITGLVIDAKPPEPSVI